MNDNIKYIQENFIESNELCQIAGICHQELNDLIEKELIPNASYKIDSTCKIVSPLGDEKTISETKKYFQKNTADLIKRNNKLKNSVDFKNKLKAEFIETFVNSNDKKFGYDNILNKNGSVNMEKLELAFEQEWKYYLQGIYGICTLNGTGTKIAKKEIAIKKLIEFNKKHVEKKLTESEKETLINLNDEFNQVSNQFAPYQRKNSSRGKFFVETNKKLQLTKN